MTGITYYDRNCDAVFETYNSLNPTQIHQGWAPALLPPKPGFACDIGAGSGRDANWLADKSWEVVAVEPSAMREKAVRDSHDRVVWMNDSLPDLRQLRALGRRFDLILLSGVWMHLAPKRRKRAFRILSELLGPAGLLVITLRHGGDPARNAARGLYDTSADELIGYANRRAIALRSRTTQPDVRRGNITWETLVFAMPDDGTGSLPILRNVIVNDNKSSTYKLALLRTLVRLAETAPGLVVERTDDHVYLPFGAVGLYWLKQYLPLLLHHRLPQRPSGPGGYGWAKRAFYLLGAESLADLQLGARLDTDRAAVLTEAINDSCANIEKMPVRHITHPGSANRPLFESEFRLVRESRQPIVLSRQYLKQFGFFRIPAPLWQTLGQYACWLDPVIVREWRRLTADWENTANRNSWIKFGPSADDNGHPDWDDANVGEPATDGVYEWAESGRDTSVASNRAKQLHDHGFALKCVWSESRIRSSPHIDHCFPWSRWRNNDLWNLLPARAAVNNSKSDLLPSYRTMFDARACILDWWQNAWVGSRRESQFLMEARYSLPGIADHNPGLDDIFLAAMHQRARLRQDQQIAEWQLPSSLS